MLWLDIRQANTDDEHRKRRRHIGQELQTVHQLAYYFISNRPCRRTFDKRFVHNKKQGYTSEEIFESVKEQYKGAGFIHRLDRNTSGIMIFSLNGEAEKELINGFKTHSFIKIYLATVYGKMPKKSDLLTAYLVKDSDNAIVKIYDKKVNGSVLIKTGYTVIEQKKDTSIVSVRLYTGKTHQIRAHLAHIGNPILGDGKYGDFEMNNKYNAKSQMLSATQLTLNFDKQSPLYYLNGKTFSLKGE